MHTKFYIFCIKFRYAGYKGVLAVNPELDRAIKWFNKNQPEGVTREDMKAVHFYFRPSQLKFDMTEEQKQNCRIEIVKYSSTSRVSMNRQLINILDQVML